MEDPSPSASEAQGKPSRGVSRLRGVLELGTFREIRSLLTTRTRRLAVAGLAAGFALISMLVGGMITLVPTQGLYTAEVIWWGAPTDWWYYPEGLVVQPWGVVQLPLFPTVATVLVSIGASVGAVTGAVLVRGLLRSSRPPDDVAYGSAVATAGGSGVASLATLGACCCSSCASGGGLALVAAVSGTSAPALLGLAWYLPLFQLVVVYVMLLAQERSLRRALSVPERPPVIGGRLFASIVLRLGLLVAGLTWSLTMFVEWSTTNPWAASAADWYHWIFEHQLLSLLAIGFAMFPREIAGAWTRGRASLPPKALRVALGVAGASWGTWVPPVLVARGLGGFLNEVFGALGLSSAWGAIPPDSIGGPLLVFHWGFQHLLLSGFALVVAANPARAARPLLWGVPREYTAADRPVAVVHRATGRPVAATVPTGPTGVSPAVFGIDAATELVD